LTTVTLPANTTLNDVHQGITAYFGGTWVEDIRAYQGGPLLSWGLGTARAGVGKRLNFQDYVNAMPAGRGMGALMIVEMSHDQETRRSNAGPPVVNGEGQIIAGGIRFIRYRVQLNIYHFAQADYAEDATVDQHQLVEAVKQLMRYDRTLGGICTQAGEGRFGIKTRRGQVMIDANDRVGRWIQMEFEVLTQIIA
jgi:hypothetical protein